MPTRSPSLIYRCAAGGADSDTVETDALIPISQLLAPDAPPHLVRTAHAVCGDCEPDLDFTLALDLILNGAKNLERATR